MKSESTVRNAVLVFTGGVFFVACFFGSPFGVGASMVAAVAALWWAVRYGETRALFRTDFPESWPPGVLWRSWYVVDVTPDTDTGRWVVFGRRAW